MKKIVMALVILALGSPTLAGNLDTFEAPAEVEPVNEPMGGSNAAWIIPLIAVIAIAAAASGDDDDEEDTTEEVIEEE